MYKLTECSIGAALILFATAANAQPAGDAEAGKLRAGLCAGCHAIPGYRNAYPTYSVPKLGGQHAAYIVTALKAYQTGQRSHPTMQAIAASLSDKDMADLGAYFAGIQQ
ncbi:MAG: c-type cytochrome [Gammaproteobacteria bacterium]